jgi:hypothetical protein
MCGFFDQRNHLMRQDLLYFIKIKFSIILKTLSESMGNVPLYTRPSQNLLKLSGFVELGELIILV